MTALGRFATTAELFADLFPVLWAFASTDTFEYGTVLIINLAGDADTNCKYTESSLRRITVTVRFLNVG
jgi:hypothetical protein